MSHMTSGILGGTAVALLLGAIQFASGSDLRATVMSPNAKVVSQDNAEAVNRAGKSDRAPVVMVQDGHRTLSFPVYGLSDTSLVVRIKPNPVKVEKVAARTDVASARPVKSIRQKLAVACEPPVSVLTDVARLLEAGRCLT